MTELHFLKELVIVLAATIAIVIVFEKLRLPSIVGFLLAGVIMGPQALAIIQSADVVEILAEIGVVLLLFTIGIEFSLDHILSAPRRILLTGLLQIGLTVVVVVAVALLFGVTVPVGIFYGFLVALSSTAIVLRLYKDRGEIHSIHGRIASSILLLQDLCIIPMMLLVPVLARTGEGELVNILIAMSKAIVALVAIVWTARKLLPRLLHQVALIKNHEIFVLFVVLISLGIAWLTSEVGLSLALGALVAGLVVSESEQSHQIVADVMPLRDCFSGIFFMSIGMLLNLDLLAQDLTIALAELILMVAIKSLVIFAIVWRLYGSLRLAVLLALALAQIGEFSFILAKAGVDHKLISVSDSQVFLAASILSMIATPFLLMSVNRLAHGAESLAGQLSPRSAPQRAREEITERGGHVVVIGYGLNGQNLTRVLKEVSIPFLVLEMDPDLVHQARRAGTPVIFGDGARWEILHQATIEKARAVVIAISDPAATSRIVAEVRRMNRETFIIVRTRYVAEIEPLYRLGADEVIPEEFETSVEIFARVLQRYHVPRNVIALQIDLIRREHYGALRGIRLQGTQLDQLSQFLAGTTTDIFSIMADSPAAGRRLDEIKLRERCGATVIAAVRNGRAFHDLTADFVIEAGDALVLLGDHKALDQAGDILNPPSA
jgi:monovalent cation:H+ antiporter-2, CPA2 family